MNSLSVVLLIVLALAVGCGEQVAPNLHTAPARSTPKYTEAELNKLIVPGMTTAELTAKVGDPGSAIQVSTNLFMATYLFRFDPQNEGLAGFSVYIADGHVTKWSPITGDSHKTFVPGGSARSFGEQSFQLFLATDELKSMVDIINTEGSADASGVTAPPVMTFKANVSTVINSKGRPGEQTVMLLISDHDASRLKDVTENNIGNRMLIVCHNRGIAALVISQPIGFRQLMFPVKNSNVLNAFQNQ
jgi:hypothetical protein